MTTLVFTICAQNYVGLAKVLGESLARHGRDIDFRIYVADSVDCISAGETEAILPARAALQDIIPDTEYANMALMYNITEFCTALKAACFMHGFAAGYDKCVYMDPDIFLVGDMDYIVRQLDACKILITPHLCLPSLGEGPRPDHGILATGVYNLGFLALRNSAEAESFLRWWHERLRKQAFNDHYHALFTDQRWMDFVPSLFPGAAVRVWRHLGCNLAPWNYHERQVVAHGDGFMVHPRQPASESGMEHVLIFLHFSGFDFRRILDGQMDQLNLKGAETHPDIVPLYDLYGTAIRSLAQEMAHYLAVPYMFDRYADGSLVLPSHRRLFRVWRERNGDAADPFGTGAQTFHAALADRGLLAQDDGRDLAADKASARSVKDPGRLIGRAQSAFRLLFRVAGRSRFFFLIRGLNRLANVEQHYDTFRLGDAAVRRSAAGVTVHGR